MPETTRRRRRSVLRVIVVAELVVALVTAATVVYGFNHLDSNIEALPDFEHIAPKPEPKPEQPKTPLNILVMGSDTRDCDGCDIDNEDGRRRLRHHDAAARLGGPEDGVRRQPGARHDGRRARTARSTARRSRAPKTVQFNEAFTVGGPLCTVQQVEHLTGIYIDHTVVVNFGGFKDMVDAVHGVEVCIPFEVDDPAHGIHLDAGTQYVSGQEALNYVRERHVLSVNSDIGRMKRQQAFVASMTNRVLSANTLAQPSRLYRFLDAATDSIQLDKDLASLGKLFDLGRELRDIDLRHIKFVTVPIETYPADINRLQFAPEADALWEAIKDDEPLGKLGRDAISADDTVGSPDDDAETDSQRERLANGLCA